MVLDECDNHKLHSCNFFSAFGMDLVQVRHVRLIVEEFNRGGFYRGICDSREETPVVRCVQRNMQTCGSRKGDACGLIFLERTEESTAHIPAAYTQYEQWQCQKVHSYWVR